MVRAGAYKRTADIYPATAVDTGVLYSAVTMPFQIAGDSDAQDGLVYLFVPAAVVDLPIALVVDTAYLPHDLRKAARRRAKQEQQTSDSEVSDH